MTLTDGRGRTGLLSLTGTIALSLLVGVAASQAGSPLPDMARFQFERQAQNHCPGEVVVWVDPGLPSYSVATDRFYARTKTGAFVCLRDAENAGYHANAKL